VGPKQVDQREDLGGVPVDAVFALEDSGALVELVPALDVQAVQQISDQ
jgi:hypothetical protein